MNASLKALFATLALSAGMAVHAEGPSDTDSSNLPAATSSGGLTHAEARNEKTQAKAEYKAKKKVAEANKTLDVADCKTASLDSKELRDCKKEASIEAKETKREAKQLYKAEKADIKAQVN